MVNVGESIVRSPGVNFLHFNSKAVFLPLISMAE